MNGTQLRSETARRDWFRRSFKVMTFSGEPDGETKCVS
jgi:hypothetical protein